MTRLKQAKSLHKTALNLIRKWILKLISGKSKADDDLLLLLNDFFTPWLTPCNANEIVQATIHDSSLEPSHKLDLLESLLCPTLTALKFTFLNEVHYPRLVKLIKLQGEHLTELNLFGVWLQGQDRRSFSEGLRRMRGLKKLSVPHIANDNMLDILARSCDGLKYLDLAGASEISGKGVTKLLKVRVSTDYSRASALSKTLLYLNLGGPGGTPLDVELVSSILQGMRQLASIGGYPFTAAAVIRSGMESNLRYAHDRKTDCQTLGRLAELCPQLTGVYLDSPGDGVIKYMSMFKGLRKLKLSKVKSEQIEICIEKLPQLESLELVSMRGSLDLTVIASSCSRLTNLTIYYSRGVHASSWSDLCFPSLKKLTVYDTEMHGCCKPLLRGCPALEEVTLCDCADVNDDELFDVLGVNPMSELRELALLAAPLLTIQSARCLMTCVDKLHYLGRLDLWNLSFLEVGELRHEISEYQLDITLWEQFSSLDQQLDLADHQQGNGAGAEGEEFVGEI